MLWRCWLGGRRGKKLSGGVLSGARCRLAHPGSPGQRAVKRVCVCVLHCYAHVGSILARDASSTRICDCRILRTLPHFSHILAKWAYRLFSPHKLAFSFSTTISIFYVFFYLKQYSLWSENGRQFASWTWSCCRRHQILLLTYLRSLHKYIFLHISCLYGLHILKKMPQKLASLSC